VRGKRYVRTARARACRAFGHPQARNANALTPVITLGALELGTLL